MRPRCSERHLLRCQNQKLFNGSCAKPHQYGLQMRKAALMDGYKNGNDRDDECNNRDDDRPFRNLHIAGVFAMLKLLVCQLFFAFITRGPNP
jgi:hypothetical protein